LLPQANPPQLQGDTPYFVALAEEPNKLIIKDGFKTLKTSLAFCSSVVFGVFFLEGRHPGPSNVKR